ncbi:MAG TPA: hypothetical protein EYP22_10455 [Methanosarcinales archaeon]|nr:hypothetical protein [Methanosarcinales archaeon]
MSELKMKKIKLTITDIVQDIDYRVFLAQKAVEHCVPRFKAENLPDGKTVVAYLEAPEHIIKEYIETINILKPEPQYL